MAQVFLGTAASKILRHAPVPVMIVPKQQAHPMERCEPRRRRDAVL
jgi:hypothetical protein